MDLFNSTNLRLDNAASANNTRELCVLGVVPPHCFLRALFLIRDERYWSDVLGGLLKAGAIAFLLAALVMSACEYWPLLPFPMKVGLVQLGLVGTVIAGRFAGLDSAYAKLCFVIAIALVGFLLLLLMRHYPTVSDSWVFYVGWFALSLPWIVCSRSSLVWCLGLLIAHFGAFMWAYQIGIPNGLVVWQDFIIVVALANFTVLMAMEFLGGLFFRREKTWLWLFTLSLTLSISLFLACYAVLNGLYLSRHTALFIFLTSALCYFYYKIYPKYYGLVAVAVFTALLALWVLFVNTADLLDSVAGSITVFLGLLFLAYGIGAFIVFSLLSVALMRMNRRKDMGLLP